MLLNVFSLPIAETTIVLAALYLTRARDLVHERFGDVVKVVYGDTDSVFLKTLETMSVSEAIKLGDKISKEISGEFPDPVFLEFEKVMFPSMLVNRKVLYLFVFETYCSDMLVWDGCHRSRVQVSSTSRGLKEQRDGIVFLSSPK